MANQEHLDLLKQGVETWNAWRRENAWVWPDLRGADLTEMNLKKANLAKADLAFVGLSKADLLGANFYLAILSAAILSGAKLYGVNFNGADLTEADLTGVDFRRVRLIGTNLTRANLREANFENVQLGETVFANTDLTGATGLDRCRHIGPSTLDHRTLARSGTLPLAFLRGCGLPDWLIEAYKFTKESLSKEEITNIGYEAIRLRTGQPFAIQFHSCFISYSSQDDDFARRLHDGLQDKGVRCWFAPEDLKIGDEFRNVIEDAVRLHDKVLLILSKASVKSEWVKDEVETALEKERKRKPKQTVLFPIRIDDAIQRTRQPWASKLRRQRHIGDFTHWKDHDQYNTAFQRLLRDLKA